MPMMMHHGQPLWTWRSLYGLLNQVPLPASGRRADLPGHAADRPRGQQKLRAVVPRRPVLSHVGGRPVEEFQSTATIASPPADP